MVRAGMAAVIAQMRLLIADPDGDAETFSDGELQGFCDARSVEMLYAPLRALPTIAPGGNVQYLQWVAEQGWWESDTVLVDGNYNVLTPTVADPARGRWTFAATQDAVLARGARCDIYAAAADAVEAWLARVKLDYDFSADGADYKRSQQVAGLTALLGRLRGQGSGGGATVGRLVRRDT